MKAPVLMRMVRQAALQSPYRLFEVININELADHIVCIDGRGVKKNRISPEFSVHSYAECGRLAELKNFANLMFWDDK